MKKKITGALCQVNIAYWRRETSVRQYIDVPIPPAPLLLADRWLLHLIWLVRTKEIKKRGGPNSSVRLTYFQANRLLTQHYKLETEIH
jgi:hypothetical protein